MAERQHRESVVIPAGRGTIFDTNGVQLAIGEQTKTIYADPRELSDPRAVAIAAHRILGVDANQLYPQLLNRKTAFVYVQRFADPTKAAALMKKGFTGVNDYPEEKRAYPQGTVASQVVGFAGTDNKGLGGLEIEYDKQLAGKPGRQTVVRDPFGRAIDVVSATPERQGHDVFTTIDNKIQANAEQVLRETVAKWHARSATAIVLDPHTGAVLAMAQAPGLQRERLVAGAAVAPDQPCSHGRVRARLGVQARHRRGRAHRGARDPALDVPAAALHPGRRQVHPRRGAARHGDVDRREDPVVLVERRRDHDRREARRAGAR